MAYFPFILQLQLKYYFLGKYRSIVIKMKEQSTVLIYI